MDRFKTYCKRMDNGQVQTSKHTVKEWTMDRFKAYCKRMDNGQFQNIL